MYVKDTSLLTPFSVEKMRFKRFWDFGLVL